MKINDFVVFISVGGAIAQVLWSLLPELPLAYLRISTFPLPLPLPEISLVSTSSLLVSLALLVPIGALLLVLLMLLASQVDAVGWQPPPLCLGLPGSWTLSSLQGEREVS